MTNSKLSECVSKIAIFILMLINLCYFSTGQIHRATNQGNYHIKYDNNFTLQYYLNKLIVYSDGLQNEYEINGNLLEKDVLIVWASSIIGTFFVSICGVLPVVILPKLADDDQKLFKSNSFKCLISFAGGSLLGDVFIHLFPETYATSTSENSNKFYINNGLWTLFGILIFFCIEKLFPDDDEDQQVENYKKHDDHQNTKNTYKKFLSKFHFLHSIKTIGFLNLLANFIDNFTHGIAVSGGFQASFKFGVLSLIATLLHEIPHEIGDFVILLKSGLNYKQAALAQLITSSSGIFGSIFALSSYSTAEKAGSATAWILPFTSGGFLYISLSNIIPDLIAETDFRQSIRQILSLMLGVFVIYIFSFII